MLIEEIKESYYSSLRESSEKWHDGENNAAPFIVYMLGILLKAYTQCDERFRLIAEKKRSSAERVLSVITKSLEPLSKRDIIILCPGISQRTVERALKELQDTQKIRQIDKGRATRYVKLV